MPTLMTLAYQCHGKLVVIRDLALMCGEVDGGGSLQGPWELVYY